MFVSSTSPGRLSGSTSRRSSLANLNFRRHSSENSTKSKYNSFFSSYSFKVNFPCLHLPKLFNYNTLNLLHLQPSGGIDFLIPGLGNSKPSTTAPASIGQTSPAPRFASTNIFNQTSTNLLQSIGTGVVSRIEYFINST